MRQRIFDKSVLDRACRNLWIDDVKCWVSTIVPPARQAPQLEYKRNNLRAWVSQAVVLWTYLFGYTPFGDMTKVCGTPNCVNPFHFYDQPDRDQREWVRTYRQNNADLLNIAGYDKEDSMENVFDLYGLETDEIRSRYGMTSDFGCYHCGRRFDPTVSKNQVICNDCWEDDDAD